MTAEANYYEDGDTIDYTPTAALVAGQVVQLADGRAGVAISPIAAGVKGAVQICGVYKLAKTASVSVLNGDEIYWHNATNACTPLHALGADDYTVGVAIEDDVAGTATTLKVSLNVKPRYKIDLHRDAFESLVVKTVVGSTTVTIPDVVTRGGQTQLTLGATAEAQKVDLMSKDSLPTGVPFIVEGRVAIYDISAGSVQDFNIGIANGTHATDADAITEHVFFHLDGNVLTILAQSKDGTTTVAAVTTTVSCVDDTYFDFRIDCRNLSAIKLYINGVGVLTSTGFKLNAGAGPWKLLAHLEKTSDAGIGDLRVTHFAARTMEQAA